MREGYLQFWWADCVYCVAEVVSATELRRVTCGPMKDVRPDDETFDFRPLNSRWESVQRGDPLW